MAGVTAGDTAEERRAGGGTDLSGRVCVVTGGSRGIGAAIARGVAAAGARLAVFGRDEERLDRFAAETREAFGAEVLAVPVDVADDVAVASGFERVVETWGRVDGLVNNAGINVVGPSLTYDLADWRRVIDTNLTGAFLCTQQAGRAMANSGGGSIVTIASMTSFTGQPQRAAYIASKTGVLGMTRALAVEWGPLGIRVNAIAPGYIRTDLVDDLIERGVLQPERLEARTPLRRLGDPADLVGAALFLLGDQSAFSTGQAITLDGGWLANGFVQ